MTKKKPRKGMILNVYRCAAWGDCTNGGLSSHYKDLLLVGPGVPEIFEERPGLPVVIMGEIRGSKHVRPADEPLPGFNGWMMGGNFAWSSDSRLREIFEYPVAIHDRQEEPSHG